MGGFHPRFQAPAQFPRLRRLSLTIEFNERARLLLEAYFAITSNTLQFGANAQLTATAMGATFAGQLRFDALLTFSPFAFRVDFAAGLSISVRGLRLLAVRVEGVVQGPTPWRIVGRASISILFFDISVGFDVSFGTPEARSALIPPSDGPLTALVRALGESGAWSPQLAEGEARAVTLGAPEGSERILFVDPVGGLQVRQKVVPLNRPVSRYAEAPLPAPLTLRIMHVTFVSGTGRVPVSSVTVQEPFAPNQFELLSEDARLSRPSFEKMDAGLSLSASGVEAGTAEPCALLFEILTIESDDLPSVATRQEVTPEQLTFALLHDGVLVARRMTGDMGAFKGGPGQGPKLHLDEERCMVARSASWTSPAPLTSTATAAESFARRDIWEREHPEDRCALVVLPIFEIERAA